MGEALGSAVFVWTKMQTESGMNLPAILAIKEIERLAGSGVFWWGVGQGLGESVREHAKQSGGTLPVLFSIMLSTPQQKDAKPNGLRIWTKYETPAGRVDMPPHVLEFSGDSEGRNYHFALICHSHIPLAVTSHGAFDPTCYRTVTTGRPPGDRAVTVLLRGNLYEDHPEGKYHFGFRATLVEPWAVRLVCPRRCPKSDGQRVFDDWKAEWGKFVARVRDKHDQIDVR